MAPFSIADSMPRIFALRALSGAGIAAVFVGFAGEFFGFLAVVWAVFFLEPPKASPTALKISPTAHMRPDSIIMTCRRDISVGSTPTMPPHQ